MNNSVLVHAGAISVWRKRILSIVAWSFLGLGGIDAIVSIGVALSAELWSIVAFDAIILLIGAGLALCPDRFYRFKSNAIIVLTYVVGGYLSYNFGPFASGPLWLFAAPMLSGALNGWRAALGSIGLLIIVLVAIGVLLANGLLNWPGELVIGGWILISASLVALSGVLSISIGLLLEGVDQAIREREVAIEASDLLEMQLRHSHKMEAIGTLAGGIAHDFNNLLNVISGFTEFAIDTLEDDPPAAISDLSEVMVTVTRAKSLTDQLLTFSHKGPANHDRIDINDSIRNAIRLLELAARDDILLDIKLCSEVCGTRIDPDSLIQILLNAITNAAYAMPEGGVIRIETSRVPVDESSAKLNGHKMEPGEYVVVSVTDTGSGIPQKILEEVFEPFFTTKKMGEGTGLGLSTTWAVVNQVGGYVNLKSELDHGTTLECFFHFIEGPAPTID